MKKQRIVLLGATGSIGTQALQIVEQYPDLFELAGMSAGANAEKLTEYADRFHCEKLFLRKDHFFGDRGVKSLDDLIGPDIDHLIVADHGLESFSCVLKALTMKIKVSIANKELLIIHGADLLYFAREQQTEIIPLDSEHNAIFQCLRGETLSSVSRLIITASGGPFREKDYDSLKGVTIDEVLKHPNWAMGKKTTVDSATLVNKAFEVIEAHILFGIPFERIEVRLHPESVVHGIVEFTDGSSKILAYPPDMRFSIGYAMFYPERAENCLTGNDQDCFDYTRDLHFEPLESGRFPCYDLVLETARKRPESLRRLVHNDELAVSEFLKGKIAFDDILTCLSDGLT